MTEYQFQWSFNIMLTGQQMPIPNIWGSLQSVRTVGLVSAAALIQGLKENRTQSKKVGGTPLILPFPQRAAHFQKLKHLKTDRMRDQGQLESRCFGEMGRIFVARLFILLKAESN